MTDVFSDVRRLVSAREVAELNGLHPNRSGFVCCPFHHEKTPSLKLFPDGGWKCFGCGKGGSSIDFEAALYDLNPLDAVKRLNSDFHLGLDLERREPTPQERQQAQRRREINSAYEMFEVWRGAMLDRLTACFREGHFALKSLETPADLDRLTDAQTLAIREQARFEWLADTLSGSTMEQQMQIFRERGQIGQLCEKILNHSPMKSGAA